MKCKNCNQEIGLGPSIEEHLECPPSIEQQMADKLINKTVATATMAVGALKDQASSVVESLDGLLKKLKELQADENSNRH